MRGRLGCGGKSRFDRGQIDERRHHVDEGGCHCWSDCGIMRENRISSISRAAGATARN